MTCTKLFISLKKQTNKLQSSSWVDISLHSAACSFLPSLLHEPLALLTDQLRGEVAVLRGRTDEALLSQVEDRVCNDTSVVALQGGGEGRRVSERVVRDIYIYERLTMVYIYMVYIYTVYIHFIRIHFCEHENGYLIFTNHDPTVL